MYTNMCCRIREEVCMFLTGSYIFIKLQIFVILKQKYEKDYKMVLIKNNIINSNINI